MPEWWTERQLRRLFNHPKCAPQPTNMLNIQRVSIGPELPLRFIPETASMCTRGNHLGIFLQPNGQNILSDLQDLSWSMCGIWSDCIRTWWNKRMFLQLRALSPDKITNLPKFIYCFGIIVIYIRIESMPILVITMWD